MREGGKGERERENRGRKSNNKEREKQENREEIQQMKIERHKRKEHNIVKAIHIRKETDKLTRVCHVKVDRSVRILRESLLRQLLNCIGAVTATYEAITVAIINGTIFIHSTRRF